MNLIESFKALKCADYQYYPNAPKIDFEHFSCDEAFKFIRGTYSKGAKNRIFNVGFSDKFKENGKHRHTVSLFFLGCLSKGLIDKQLEAYIGKHIDKVDWYDFLYTWYLTCLYHDTASVVEKTEWYKGCPTSLTHYLNKYEIDHNLFSHKWRECDGNPYTYSESIIKKYFSYQVKEQKHIDHGIIAGYIFYDRLTKIYNRAWAEHSSECPGASYDSFHNDGLSWSKEHFPHFAIVAEAIISHSIWRSENNDESIKKYLAYGLGELAYPNFRKIKKEERPLLFFLGLLDSIEPAKNGDFCSNDLLENISISSTEDVLEVRILSQNLEHTKWLKGLENKVNWLSVNSSYSGNNILKITL